MPGKKENRKKGVLKEKEKLKNVENMKKCLR